jgi:hypothetical protein
MADVPSPLTASAIAPAAMNERRLNTKRIEVLPNAAFARAGFTGLDASFFALETVNFNMYK